MLQRSVSAANVPSVIPEIPRIVTEPEVSCLFAGPYSLSVVVLSQTNSVHIFQSYLFNILQSKLWSFIFVPLYSHSGTSTSEAALPLVVLNILVIKYLVNPESGLLVSLQNRQPHIRCSSTASVSTHCTCYCYRQLFSTSPAALALLTSSHPQLEVCPPCCLF